MELNEKLLEKAKEAKTVEELVAVAKENGFELTAEEAKTYFAQLNPKTGELNDDELDNVAGGKKCGTTYDDWGRPVVTPYNSCEHYTHKNSKENIPHGGDCEDCFHVAEPFGTFKLRHCNCPERRNN